jgi:hypothetical protein
MTNLNINDLATMANVIEICTQRGAFRANELKPIGELFEKISMFVKAAQEQAKAAEEAAAKAAAEEGKEVALAAAKETGA